MAHNLCFQAYTVEQTLQNIILEWRELLYINYVSFLYTNQSAVILLHWQTMAIDVNASVGGANWKKLKSVQIITW